MIGKARWKTVANWSGTFLAVASLIYVGLRIGDYSKQLNFNSLGWPAIATLAAMAVFYGASNLLLVRGWRSILAGLGVPLSASWCLYAYSKSQLGKYVPGNIFQFAGRQVIGSAAGIPHGPLVKSTIVEVTSLLGLGVLFAPLTLALFGWVSPAIAIVLFLALVFSTLFSARRFNRHFGSATALYVCFLALSGLIFVICYRAAGATIDAGTIPSAAGAYIIAWLVGLVTPGAPAGLGIREAVLIFLLGQNGSDSLVLSAVLMGRLVTVLGDLLFFALGILLTRGAAPFTSDSPS